MKTAEEVLKTKHEGYTRQDFGLSGGEGIPEFWHIKDIIEAMEEYASQSPSPSPQGTVYVEDISFLNLLNSLCFNCFIAGYANPQLKAEELIGFHETVFNSKIENFKSEYRQLNPLPAKQEEKCNCKELMRCTIDPDKCAFCGNEFKG